MKRKTKKWIHVVGARPQFVKYFAFWHAMQKSKSRTIKNKLVHTGQHYDDALSKVFFKEFGLPKPFKNLGIGSDTRNKQISKMITALEKIFLKEKPDRVIVYGDTNSTLAGTMAAKNLNIAVAHIEAGLRSYDSKMPEETNRVLTDHHSDILFCPTKQAIENLKKEGIRNSKKTKVLNVGDVMFDVLKILEPHAEKKSKVFKKVDVKSKSYHVLTLHRAENTNSAKQLRRMLNFVAKQSGDEEVLFPIHPRTKKAMKRYGIKLKKKIRPIKPLGYNDMLKLLKHAKTILTDSGGIQKEAFWLKVPCVTLRETTEWPETVRGGWNILYRHYPKRRFSKRKQSAVYGNGKAAQKIIQTLKKY